MIHPAEVPLTIVRDLGAMVAWLDVFTDDQLHGEIAYLDDEIRDQKERGRSVFVALRSAALTTLDLRVRPVLDKGLSE